MQSAEQLYMFRHAVVRDAAYLLYPPSTRSELHRLAIDATVAVLPADVIPAHAADLADHARLAAEALPGDALVETERRYRAQAAEYSMSHDLLEEALSHLGRQVELSPEQDQPMLLLRMGSYALAMGRIERCIELARRTEDIALRRNDSAMLGMARRALGVTNASLGKRAEAFALLEDSIRLFREVGDMRQVARSMNGKARLLVDAGHHAEARTLLQDLVRTTEDLNDPFQHALSLESLAELQVRTGEAQAAYDNYRKSSELMAGHGPPRSIDLPRSGMAHALVQLGQLDEAEEMLAKLIAHSRQSGRLVELTSCLEMLAESRDRRGDQEGAVALGRDAVSTAVRHGSDRLISMSRYNLGLRLVRCGILEEAEQLLTAALAARTASGDSHGQGAAHNALGLLREKQGRGQEAAVHYQRSVDIHQQLGIEDRAAEARAGLRRVTDGAKPD